MVWLVVVHSDRTEPGRGPLPSSRPGSGRRPGPGHVSRLPGAGGGQATNGRVAGSRPIQAGYRPLLSLAGRRLDHRDRHETS